MRCRGHSCRLRVKIWATLVMLSFARRCELPYTWRHRRRRSGYSGLQVLPKLLGRFQGPGAISATTKENQVTLSGIDSNHFKHFYTTAITPLHHSNLIWPNKCVWAECDIVHADAFGPNAVEPDLKSNLGERLGTIGNFPVVPNLSTKWPCLVATELTSTQVAVLQL